MKCPVCGEACRLIERAAPESVPQQPPMRQHEPARQYREDDDHYRRGHKRKRGGFLGEIFDFD